MSFIINDKLLTEHKSLRWFDWFNIDSKYRKMGIDYIPINKYSEFYNNFSKFINTISLLTTNSRYYQLANNIYIYLYNQNTDRISISYCGQEHIKCVLFNMCRVAHLWNLSLLDIFILTFWNNKITKNPFNNMDFATDNNVIYNYIILEINQNIFYKNTYGDLNIKYNIKDNYERLIKRLNDLQLNCSKSNSITNKQYIELFKNFVSTINLSIAINNKYTYIGSMYELIHYPIIVKKFDTDVYDNIIDILCATDNKIQDDFIDTLKEYNNEYNVSARLISLFFLLITDTNKLFGDKNYKKVGDLKKYYSNYVVSRSDNYTSKQLQQVQIKQEIKQEIKDISIYNINKNGNNSNIKINNTYFIQRDRFNTNYKRIYKCVGIIDIINVCIMIDISNNKIPTQQYVLSETDCEYLNIEYQDGLEVFSTKLSWINTDNNK